MGPIPEVQDFCLKVRKVLKSVVPEPGFDRQEPTLVGHSQLLVKSRMLGVYQRFLNLLCYFARLFLSVRILYTHMKAKHVLQPPCQAYIATPLSRIT